MSINEDVSDLLEEAQALMEEMGDEEGVPLDDSLVIDGFSIDDIVEEAPPLVDSVVDGRTQPAVVQQTKVMEGEDPLSSSFAAMTPATPPGTKSSATGDGQQRRSSLTLHPLQDEQVSSTLHTPSFSDVKARASGFASSMASFAQKAAAGVAAAAANTPAAAAAAAAAMNPQNAGTMSSVNQLQQTGASSSGYTMLPHVELDNDQKQALIEEHLGPLLPGERVIMFLSSLLHVSDSSGWDHNLVSDTGMWCCCMTFYRVVLFYTETCGQEAPPEDWDEDCWPVRPTERHLQMPLASMDRVEKSIYTTSQNISLMGLIMHGKDNGRQLRFTTPSYADTLRVHESIQTYAFPGRRNLGYLFAFESKREEVMSSIVLDNQTGKKTIMLKPTHKRFDAVTEFNRQFGHLQPSPWTLYTKINSTYQLCMSYPSVLVGPSSLPEESQETQRVLRQTASFRSEQRLPALTWSSGRDGASLWRASQPKVGLQGNRNAADEFFVRHIGEAAARCNSLCEDKAPIPSKEFIQKLTGQPDFGLTPGATLKIMDMRARASAMANRTQGYGYENTSHYVGTTLQFCNIGNIHAVRDAYQKMSTLCMSATTLDSSWMSLIEDTKWLHHIRQILAAAWEAAFWCHVHRLPVLLHCSHGWDRTSQVGCISQLLLDPFYRTRVGFACLVEKDFLSFGHPFHTRCSHGEGRGSDTPASAGGDEGQISPIFIQFLDCVYQLVSLFPEKFEFNSKYLLVLSEHVYSCRFGTLLCDTERERELVAGIRQRTHSVWDYLDSREDCLNSDYRPSKKVLLMPLPLLLRGVTLWTDRHTLYGPKPTNRLPYQPSQIVPVKETPTKMTTAPISASAKSKSTSPSFAAEKLDEQT